MKITVDKFNGYIEQYVKGRLIQAAEQQLTKFKLGFALGTGRLAATPDMVEAAKAAGIADADGNIDVELLKKATLGGIDAAGELPLPMLGIYLSKDDIDRFFRLVETGALS